MPKPLILTADAQVAGGQPPVTEHPWQSHGAARSRVLDFDPLYNKTTTYWYEDGQQWLTETWHDITPIVEANKARYNAVDERARLTSLRDDGEVQWTHTATVPLALVPDVLKLTNNGKDRAAVTRWHKDPENRHFLVRPIRKGV